MSNVASTAAPPAIRVVVGEDSYLMREGVARISSAT